MNADPIGRVGPPGLDVQQLAAFPNVPVTVPAMGPTLLQGLKKVVQIHQEVLMGCNDVTVPFNASVLA